MSVENFFEFARARHEIYRSRARGQSWPWTTDPILLQYRFTNVFRELDRTTAWFSDNVRSRVSPENALLATVVFRWFNRIKTGEAIFMQQCLGLMGEREGDTPFDHFVRTGDVGPMRASILTHCGEGPYVTGAYIIKTPDGMNKLDGVLQCLEWFYVRSFSVPGSSGFLGGDPLEFNWCGATQAMLGCNRIGRPWSLESLWSWLRQFPYLGDFMAYEIVTDLRHTQLLDRAPDIRTWANPGPGATRGLGRVYHGDRDKWNQHRHKSQLIDMMQGLLTVSADPNLWPSDWPSWEMREVEHTLCEFDKYERVRTGEGRPRGVYRPS